MTYAMSQPRDPKSPAPASPKKPVAPLWARRDWMFMGGMLGLMLIGLLGAAAATGWDKALAQMTKLGAAQIGALLGLSLVNYLCRAIRWHMLARRLGVPQGAARNMLQFLAGFSMTVTPGRVGELIRMRWISRATGWRIERSAPLALVDRALDLAAMGLLLALSLLLATRAISGALPVALLALLAAWVATRPALLAALAQTGYRATGLFPRLFARIRRAARSLSVFSHGATLGAASLLGLIGWAAEGYAFFLLLQWFGAEVSLGSAIAIFTFSALAGGLTGAPGGLGGAEAAMVALLLLEGVPMEISLPATALIRLTTLWFAIALGLALLPLAETTSKRGAHALEDN